METLLGVVSNFWTEITSLVAVISGSAILLVPVAYVFVRKTIGGTKALLGTGGGRRR